MKLIDFKYDKYIKDKNSFDKLKDIGFPTKKTEEFKQFDISEIFSNTYSMKSDKSKNKDYKEFFDAANQDFYTLFIINGKVDIHNSILPESIIYEQKNKNSKKTFNALYHLSETFIEKENSIFIQDNLDKPLMIKNIFDGNACFIPSGLNITLKDGCHADIVETFACDFLNNSFLNTNRVLRIGKNALLNYVKLQNMKTDNIFISNFIPKIGENSTCKAVVIDLGSKTSLNIIDTILLHEKSSFSLEGITKLNKEKRSGNIVSIIHDAKYTNSNIVCKHILDDNSLALFEVKSTVNHEAKYSKTFQNSQTILLKDGARINANPKLLLHTDELEAAHGATTGSLGEDELYYMMSRGISEKKAANMLINAIELQVINKIEGELVKELVLRFIEG